MPPATQTAPTSKAQIWAGRILTALPLLFLLVDGVMKLFKPAPVFGRNDPARISREPHCHDWDHLAVCVVIYAIPQTSILGAILLTGYLGGAVATHLRIADTARAAIPLVVGILAWGGLYLRDSRIRQLVPFRRSA